jgi:hypothetical protein
MTSHQGKPSNQVHATEHVIVAKVLRDGRERAAQTLQPLHLVGRTE